MLRRKIIMAPGVRTDRPVSSAAEWEGKHLVAEELIKTRIPDIQRVCVMPGTRGRPVDSISVTVDPGGEHNSKKRLTRTIEVLLKSWLGLIIDYRVVSIR